MPSWAFKRDSFFDVLKYTPLCEKGKKETESKTTETTVLTKQQNCQMKQGGLDCEIKAASENGQLNKKESLILQLQRRRLIQNLKK